jgi:hypothetical protein
LGALLATASCGGTLDAGTNVPHGLLPVDERNPMIIENDGWSDNWLGEYAVLLANDGGPKIAGIIAVSSPYWPDGNANATGWKNLESAARAGGLTGVPEPTISTGAPLVRPSDGQIDSTVPNRSAGAQRMIDVSRAESLPWRPVVVIAAAQLTDVADAYLMDHTVVDRVVVVSVLGTLTANGATMAGPNGDHDAWADWIVVQRFRYVQVSAYYDQTGDVPAARLGDLPQNPFGTWIAQKQPNVFDLPTASDQVAILSVGVSGFATAVERVSPDTSTGFSESSGPPLVADENGKALLVTRIAAPLAQSRLWQMLLEPRPKKSP